MVTRKIFGAGLALLALAVAGCGGNHGSLPNVPTNSQLTFTATGTYNGTSSQLNAGNATTTEVGGNTVVRVATGGRVLEATIPTTTIHAGDTFTIGGEGGAGATYTETRDRATTYSWIANSGTLTFSTTTDGATVATVEIDGMTFVADATIEGNPATGGFTMRGFLGGVPIDISGGIGGSVEMIFSNTTGTQVDGSAMTTGTVTYTASEGLGYTLVATGGTATSTRVFTFYTPPLTSVGVEYDLMGHGSNNGYVTYAQSDGGAEWIATGGKMKILERSLTTMTVQLIGATFAPANAGTNGTFTVNGTVSRTASE